MAEAHIDRRNTRTENVSETSTWTSRGSRSGFVWATLTAQCGELGTQGEQLSGHHHDVDAEPVTEAPQLAGGRVTVPSGEQNQRTEGARAQRGWG